jgi:hypothetical protein
MSFLKILKPAIFFIGIFFISNIKLNAQTPGLIYKQASSALGKSVLDPNGDGFISATAAGFSGTTDFGAGSELSLISMPIMEGEPDSDLTTGSNGGHTDLVSNTNGTQQTSYIGVKTVNGVKYLIVRIRIGGASTASKGYSLLIDTDGVFGTFSGNNPGFEKEVVLETGNNGRVAIYTHTPANQTTSLAASYAVDEYHQRSVAASTVNSSLDYFYDFFVPFSGLGISESDLIRFTAATITSAGSGISGTVSDFNGIDDKKYGNNRSLLMSLIINAFPAATLAQLSNPNFVFALPKTPAPTVNGGILTSATSISGTSTEANGTVITVYKNGTQLGSTTTVSNNAWTLTGVSGLVVGDVLTAKALAANKTLSEVSNSVAVTAVSVPSCYTPRPVINFVSNSGNITANVSWTPPTGMSFSANSVRIRIFKQTGVNTFVHTFANGSEFQYYPTTGTMTYALGGNGNFDGSLVAEAIWNDCSSGYSNTINFYNSSVITTNVTIAPTVTTDPINVVVGSQTISVKNNHGANAVLTLYSNGSLIGTSSVISTTNSATFSISGLSSGDRITARAQGQSSSDLISVLSNEVVVGANQQNTPTQAPIITGTYTAGTGKTITGTSVEPAGTTITVYKGPTLIGTVTVSAFSTWELTNQTLATSDVLTAYAKAGSKSISVVSNSVTVQASAPSAPTVTGTYSVGATSISGVSGNTLVNVYVDGSIIGTATPSSGSWTLSGLSSTVLYRGAVIYATNVVNGIESAISNTVTVIGVASFAITRANGQALGTIVSGDVLPIKIVAMDGNNGSGNAFSAFNGNVTLSAQLPVILGGGSTGNFTSGQLGGGNGNNKEISLGGAGTSQKVFVSNPNDPSAYGEATINVTEALWKGTTGNSASNQAHNVAGNWTHNSVPIKGARVKFAPDVLQDMVLETEYEWESIDLDNANSRHSYNIVLKGHDLTVKSILNRGNSVVKTTGEGKLKLGVTVGGTTEFPVANSSNNFLKITNNTNEVDTFGVRVIDDFQTGGTTGSTVTGNFVKRTWDIAKTKVNSGSGLNLEFNWTQSEEQGTQGIAYDMYHHRSGVWAREGSVVITNLTSTERKGVFTGYTGTFSPFTLWDANTTLPVTWLSFTASKVQEKVLLSWVTGTEINTKNFEIQYSTNTTDWSPIGTVLAAGNSSTQRNYSFVHTSPLKNNNYNYYRILQRDLDGKFSYSKIVSILFDEPGPEVVVYPNPVDDVLTIYTSTEQVVSLYNAAGSLVWKAKLPAGRNQLPVNKFSKGVYILATDQLITKVIIR